MGKAAFAHIQDKTAKFKFMCARMRSSETAVSSVFDLLDIGDIIGVQGTVFKTKTGETSIKAMS